MLAWRGTNRGQATSQAVGPIPATLHGADLHGRNRLGEGKRVDVLLAPRLTRVESAIA